MSMSAYRITVFRGGRKPALTGEYEADSWAQAIHQACVAAKAAGQKYAPRRIEIEPVRRRRGEI